MNAPFPQVFAQCDRGGLLEFLRKQSNISPEVPKTIQETTRRAVQNLPDQTPNEWIKGQNGRWMAIQGTND